jgi:hypothetical protein
MSTFQGQKNPWRPLWQGKVYDSGYQYERLQKVEKEDKTGLLQKLPQIDKATIEIDGYVYEFRQHPQFGPQISRKQLVAIPNQPMSNSNPIQQQVNQQRGPSNTQTQTSLEKSISIISDDIGIVKAQLASLLIEHKLDPNGVEFQPASKLIKDDHDNSISGSDTASSGLGVVENPVHITDEQTDYEEDVTDQ